MIGVTERAVRIEGHTLFTRTVPGEGLPVVLLHGVGASHTTWVEVPRLLSAVGVGSIAIDLPGHGDSSKDGEHFTIPAFADAVAAALADLGVDRFHLVGHSLGGGVSLQLAHLWPERIASLTLASAGGLGPEVSPSLRAISLPGADLVLRGIADRRTVAGVQWVGSRLNRMGVDSILFRQGTLDSLTAYADPQQRHAFLSTLRHVVDHKGQRVDGLEALDGLDGSRVLITWGERDSVIPVSHGHRAHALLSGSRLEVFAESGHLPHQDDPGRFAIALAEHVRDTGDAGCVRRADNYAIAG
jgi:pimeloyl-ACP methyl ester carboxylesterase